MHKEGITELHHYLKAYPHKKPKVDKIFGPGNQWVTAAKMLVQNETDALVSIDMPAGPSEVLVSPSIR